MDTYKGFIYATKDTLIVPRSTQPSVFGSPFLSSNRTSLNNDIVASLERLQHVIEERASPSTVPMFGAPVNDVSGLQMTFGSGPTEMMNFYTANTWVDANDDPRLSVTILLPSVPQDNVTAYFTNNGCKLILAMSVPSILRHPLQMNVSMFKLDGHAQYDRNHMQTISMKQAVTVGKGSS